MNPSMFKEGRCPFCKPPVCRFSCVEAPDTELYCKQEAGEYEDPDGLKWPEREVCRSVDDFVPSPNSDLVKGRCSICKEPVPICRKCGTDSNTEKWCKEEENGLPRREVCREADWEPAAGRKHLFNEGGCADLCD